MLGVRHREIACPACAAGQSPRGMGQLEDISRTEAPGLWPDLGRRGIRQQCRWACRIPRQRSCHMMIIENTRGTVLSTMVLTTQRSRCCCRAASSRQPERREPPAGQGATGEWVRRTHTCEPKLFCTGYMKSALIEICSGVLYACENHSKRWCTSVATATSRCLCCNGQCCLCYGAQTAARRSRSAWTRCWSTSCATRAATRCGRSFCAAPTPGSLLMTMTSGCW